MLQGLKEGFSYSFGFEPIRAILLLLLMVSLMGTPYMVLMPVFASDILHGGCSGFEYRIEMVHAPQEDDIILKINAPVKGNVISVSSFLFTENGHIEIHSYCKETDSDFFITFYKKVLKNIELDEHIKYKTTFAELLPLGLTKELRLISKNAIGAILCLGLFATIVHVRRKKQKKG